ncbi:hypothetical protein GGQ85_000746 [Nitrobacter vulgaris]|nr:hypothetical protein [Nitrobacter vulgaris]
MFLKRHEIIREDITGIALLSLSRVNVLCLTKGFPKPTRRDGRRTIYDARAIMKYFTDRVDGRTIEGRKRKHRHRK